MLERQSDVSVPGIGNSLTKLIVIDPSLHDVLWKNALGLEVKASRAQIGHDRFSPAVRIELGGARGDIKLAVWKEIASRLAIALLEAPSAIAVSTSSSRVVTVSG